MSLRVERSGTKQSQGFEFHLQSVTCLGLIVPTYLVVDCINSDWFVFFVASGDVALLRLYIPPKLMKSTSSTSPQQLSIPYKPKPLPLQV